MEQDSSAFECAPAYQNLRKNRPKGKLPVLARKSRRCQNLRAMVRLTINLGTFLIALWLIVPAPAQTFTPSPAVSEEAAQLQTLAKKIDEQNAKIDTLSQQILKLEQQIANMRPGVMVGEATPAATPSAPSTETPSHPASGNTHTVARGETLTSIAKMHGVTVNDLQKFNHIENDRKLQIGQTIMIPTAGSPAPSPSPGE
jgi:LysM repeat protein